MHSLLNARGVRVPVLDPPPVPGRVSVLVPARDEEEDLQACLTSLLDQVEVPDYEVVVVDDASSDRTAEVVRAQLPLVRHVPPQATYLAWLDCTATPVAEDPAKALLERAQLAVTDGAGFGADAFAVDWERECVTCPAGHQSAWWRPYDGRRPADGRKAPPRDPFITVHFPRRTCLACVLRPRCVGAPAAGAKPLGRQLVLHARAAHAGA